MDSELELKYEWPDLEKGFDMDALGESLIGFHSIIEELFELSRINGELEIRTVKVKEGSAVLQSVLHVVTLGINPFPSIGALYNFLEVTDPHALVQAQQFFAEIGNAAKTVDDYLNAHPFEGGALGNLLTGYMIYLIGRHQGRKDLLNAKDLPKAYGTRLHQMRTRNVYRRALRPLINGGFNRIKVAQLSVSHPKEVVIEEANLDDYLSEDQHILPEFVNGEEVTLVADVVGLQNTRGDIIKLKVQEIDPANNLLMAHPPTGKGTEHYRNLYGETVVVIAEVYRRSLVKRPELIIRDIFKQQSDLGLILEDQQL